MVSSKEIVIHLLKSKTNKLGCPPSIHVIDREINTKVSMVESIYVQAFKR
jgi:hypothetical protein